MYLHAANKNYDLTLLICSHDSTIMNLGTVPKTDVGVWRNGNAFTGLI